MGASKPINKVNAEQAKEFEEQILYWRDVLGLHRWRIERGQRPAKDAMASVEFNDDAKLVTYRLGDFGATEINHKSLSMTALHEVLHVFLHELVVVAQAKGVDPVELEAVEHSAINVLESVLFKALYGSCKQNKG